MLFTVGVKRLHCAEALSSPRRTSTQPGTFHYLHQTLPFRGTLTQHETGTSSLLAPNASLAQKSRSCQVPPVRGQRIPQHFSPEPLLHNGVVRVFRAISASTYFTRLFMEAFIVIFKQFLHDYGLWPSPLAVTAQWLFRRRSTGCLDFQRVDFSSCFIPGFGTLLLLVKCDPFCAMQACR